MSTHAPSPRIRGVPVPALFPETGPVHTLIFGEAPGPRGADQSGIPFWGDGAGLPLYRALVTSGCASVDEKSWESWDGTLLDLAGLRPALRGVALSNTFPRCPTDDGHRFRAPKRAELNAPENLKRLRAEMQRAGSLGCRRVLTLGRCAALTLAPLASSEGFELVTLPHPSSQGLLMDAPNKGRGMKLADLREAWSRRLLETLLHTAC